MKKHAIILLFLTIILSSCGDESSDGIGSTQTGTATQTFHGNGSVESTGVVDAGGDKQGIWKWYYDNGQLHAVVVFADDIFNESEPWVLYNKDSSIRADSTDGAYVFPELW